MPDQKYVLDIFSGAGGLTEGFLRNNFKFISHIEMDKASAKTLETRIAYHYLLQENKLDLYYEYLANRKVVDSKSKIK